MKNDISKEAAARLGSPDRDTQIELGQRLREARTYLGLTEEYVAEQLGVSSAAVLEMETGKREVTDLEIKRLARLYMQPVASLLSPDAQALGQEAAMSDERFRSLFRTNRDLPTEDREQFLRFAQFLRQAGRAPIPQPEDGESYPVRPIRTLLVEDDPSYLTALSTELSTFSERIEMVAGVRTAREAEAVAVSDGSLDAILLDLRIPRESQEGRSDPEFGLTVLRSVERLRAERGRWIGVLVLGDQDDAEAEYVALALRDGAIGFLVKEDLPSAEFIVDAIVRASQQIQTLTPRARESMRRASGVLSLTDRELQVWQLVRRGRTSREIAADLSMALKTVSSHHTNIYRKLGVANRAQAARYPRLG